MHFKDGVYQNKDIFPWFMTMRQKQISASNGLLKSNKKTRSTHAFFYEIIKLQFEKKGDTFIMMYFKGFKIIFA